MSNSCGKKQLIIKTVAVGNGAVGKTCMLIRLCKDEFPKIYVPTVFENYVLDCSIENKSVGLAFWDTGGGEDYPRLRPLSYPNTHVFTLLFDVSRPEDLADIENYWTPELRLHCPDVPIILVASKIDLRSQASSITEDQGLEMARFIGAAKYLEISSLNSVGTEELLQTILHIGFEHHLMLKLRKSKKCVLL